MYAWLKLSGLNESASEEMREFAEKRGSGAEKIVNGAKEKGGAAMLTYHHFKVKLPVYSKVANGVFDFDNMKKEYVKTCTELHGHMENIEEMNQTEFQELVGKLEVLGELLIKSKDSQN
jgi:hypothetical protein